MSRSVLDGESLVCYRGDVGCDHIYLVSFIDLFYYFGASFSDSLVFWYIAIRFRALLPSSSGHDITRYTCVAPRSAHARYVYVCY